jgi:hypothetical protein
VALLSSGEEAVLLKPSDWIQLVDSSGVVEYEGTWAELQALRRALVASALGRTFKRWHRSLTSRPQRELRTPPRGPARTRTKLRPIPLQPPILTPAAPSASSEEFAFPPALPPGVVEG